MISKDEFNKVYAQTYLQQDQETLERLQKDLLEKARKTSGQVNFTFPQDASLDYVLKTVEQKKSEIKRIGFVNISSLAEDYANYQKHLMNEIGVAGWFFDEFQRIGYDPKDRNVVICQSSETRGTRFAKKLEQALTVCKVNMVKNLQEADTAVYWGKYLCDSKTLEGKEEGILYTILEDVKRRDITALVFYDGNSVAQYCQMPHCDQGEEIAKLKASGKKVSKHPLGFHYIPRHLSITAW